MADYDVVVIGGGPIGLSSAYNCAKAGKSVLVLERFNFFNQSGSSNDLVRMYRTMYTEPYMADIGKASLAVWDELEHDAGESLRWMTGLLNFGDPNYQTGPEGNLLAPIPNLDRLGMRYEVLDVAQIEARYPLRDLPDHYLGLFAPDNGCINVPLLLRTLYRLAMARGAKMLSHARVCDLKLSDAGATITAEIKGAAGPQQITAEKVIIACGAYTNHVLTPLELSLKLEIWEMVYEYYATDPGPQGTYFPSMWFQFADPTDGDPAKSNLFYGFPTVPWGPPNLTRIAVDNAVNVITDPSQRRIAPAANDLQITADFVRAHCTGVDDRPNYSGTCLQTNVVDNMYVLDFLPESVGEGHDRVAVFTAGWAMKFVPVIGQILSQLVLEGSTTWDISHFKITRAGVLA